MLVTAFPGEEGVECCTVRICCPKATLRGTPTVFCGELGDWEATDTTVSCLTKIKHLKLSYFSRQLEAKHVHDRNMNESKAFYSISTVVLSGQDVGKRLRPPTYQGWTATF